VESNFTHLRNISWLGCYRISVELLLCLSSKIKNAKIGPKKIKRACSHIDRKSARMEIIEGKDFMSVNKNYISSSTEVEYKIWSSMWPYDSIQRSVVWLPHTVLYHVMTYTFFTNMEIKDRVTMLWSRGCRRIEIWTEKCELISSTTDPLELLDAESILLLRNVSKYLAVCAAYRRWRLVWPLSEPHILRIIWL